jgi:DNA-binding beta-propeller fold protein YncE
MLSPVRMASTPAGLLLIADARHRMLLRVDPATLEADQSIRLGGKPSGVALIGGRIFVGNKTSGTVDVYESDGGSFLTSFRTPSLREPSDLAGDQARGLVFVSDAQAGQILVFDTLGTFRQAISSKGPGGDQLFTPMGLAIDTTSEKVFVSDWGDFGSSSGGTAHVKVFGYDGVFIGSISGAGNCGMLGCSGGFSRPGGLDLTGERLFVPDLLLGEVLTFELASLSPVGTVGSRPHLRLPADVEVLGNTDLFVVSNGTASVESFPGVAQ